MRQTPATCPLVLHMAQWKSSGLIHKCCTRDSGESTPVGCCSFLPWSGLLSVLVSQRNDLRLANWGAPYTFGAWWGLCTLVFCLVMCRCGGCPLFWRGRRAGRAASRVPCLVWPVGALRQRDTTTSWLRWRGASGGSGDSRPPSSLISSHLCESPNWLIVCQLLAGLPVVVDSVSASHSVSDMDNAEWDRGFRRCDLDY